MTVIVGYVDKEKKEMYFGADTCIGYGNFTIDKVDDKIISFPEQELVIGFAGSWYPIQLIKHNIEIPDYEEGSDIMSYMVKEFVPMISSIVEGTISETTALGILIGFKGRLFEVDEQFCVTEPSLHYHAIGSGDRHAIGCLHTMDNYVESATSQTKVDAALNCATKFILNVRPPFTNHVIKF